MTNSRRTSHISPSLSPTLFLLAVLAVASLLVRPAFGQVPYGTTGGNSSKRVDPLTAQHPLFQVVSDGTWYFTLNPDTVNKGIWDPAIGRYRPWTINPSIGFPFMNAPQGVWLVPGVMEDVHGAQWIGPTPVPAAPNPTAPPYYMGSPKGTYGYGKTIVFPENCKPGTHLLEGRLVGDGVVPMFAVETGGKYTYTYFTSDWVNILGGTYPNDTRKTIPFRVNGGFGVTNKVIFFPYNHSGPTGFLVWLHADCELQ